MPYYRITATLNPGHDFRIIVFEVYAPRVDRALTRAIAALTRMGFKSHAYNLAYSLKLEPETDWTLTV